LLPGLELSTAGLGFITLFLLLDYCGVYISEIAAGCC